MHQRVETRGMSGKFFCSIAPRRNVAVRFALVYAALERSKGGMMGRTNGAALLVFLAVAGLEPEAKAEAWATPSGLYGGGLGMGPAQSGRAWLDAAFFTRAGENVRPGYTLLSPIFGLGVLVTPNVEIEAVVPVGSYITHNGGTGIGNPYVGASFVMDGPQVRLKVGGGVAIPIVDATNDDQVLGAYAGLLPRGLQSGWLWAPDSVGLVFPVHVEAPLHTPVLFIGDAIPYVLVPVRERTNTEMLIELSPGFGGYVSDDFVIGLRLPVVLQLTGNGYVTTEDRAQISLEPFLRLASDPVVFSLRFTMPLDEPLGFAFDTGKVWGIQLGLGGAF
jgi:hypothetical protein